MRIFILVLFVLYLEVPTLEAKFYLVDTLDASVWSASEDDFVSYRYEVYFNPDEPRYFQIIFPATEEGPNQVYGFELNALDEFYGFFRRYREWEITARSEEVMLDKSMGAVTAVFGFFKIGDEGLIKIAPEIEFHFYSQSISEHEMVLELKPLSDDRLPEFSTPRRGVYFNSEEVALFGEVFTMQYWVERFKNVATQMEIESKFQ